MSRICQHFVPEGAKNCTHCGTTIEAIAVGKGCFWRDIPDSRDAKIRPEPTLNKVACEDQVTITSRLVELQKERDAIMNAKGEGK